MGRLFPKWITIRVPPELHAAIHTAAAADGRCASEWLRQLAYHELIRRRDKRASRESAAPTPAAGTADNKPHPAGPR
jgi:hypothetical protein